jgi:multidrug transporter EmrE-like cation transporter
VPGLALPVAAGLAAAALGYAGRRRTAVLGLATGILYGVADSATKAAAMQVRHSGWTALLSPWPVVFVLSCGAAFFLFQRGLQRGPAVTVVAVMTGALNVTAVGAGLVLFGETLGATTAVVCLHAAALAAVLVATWWLSRAQARLSAADEAPAASAGARFAEV